MRRLGFALLLVSALALGTSGCKKQRKREPVKLSEGPAALASMIQAGDPIAAVQFTKGFYGVENGAWRWTSHAFTVTLHPPRGAGADGARLVLKFSLPDAVFQKTGPIKMTARVNGLDLPPEEYKEPGDRTFSREVPGNALQGEAVAVDFTLDKFIAPTPNDLRELGVIVSAVGFEVR